MNRSSVGQPKNGAKMAGTFSSLLRYATRPILRRLTGFSSRGEFLSFANSALSSPPASRMKYAQ